MSFKYFVLILYHSLHIQNNYDYWKTDILLINMNNYSQLY